MNEQLTRLAIQACTEYTARPVLGDAILELKDTPDEWWSPVVVEDLYDCKHTEIRARNLFFKRAAKADKTWCRAVASMLWFGHCNWPWPFPWTELNYVDPYSIDYNLWPTSLDAWLPQQAPGGFFGIERTPAGQFSQTIHLLGEGVITADQARQILDVPMTMSPQERILEAARRAREAGEKHGSLVELWEKEAEAAMQGTSRLLRRIGYAS